jgi:hypothetical protein
VRNDLPLVVMVCFDDYDGPGFLDENEELRDSNDRKVYSHTPGESGIHIKAKIADMDHRPQMHVFDSPPYPSLYAYLARCSNGLVVVYIEIIQVSRKRGVNSVRRARRAIRRMIVNERI